jgi:hypothetical protein
MRFSLWSDYGMPARKYGRSAHGGRPSIVRKVFLTAVLVVAAVIGIREIYGQAVEKRGILEPAARAQSQLTASASAAARRSAGIAAIPLSPQPALAADHAEVVASAIVSPTPARTPGVSAEAPSVASGVSADQAIPPALTAVPGALAKATTLPQPPAAIAAAQAPATFAATKSAEGTKSFGARNAVHAAHRTRHDFRGVAGYAEALATRFGHGKELRAALQLFL